MTWPFLFLVLAVALLATPAALAQPTSPSASGSGEVGNQGGEPRPVRAVILVDESGSLSPADVDREKDAAQVLAFGMLNNDSEVAVVGFGSSNGPGQSAVDTVCPLTSVDPSKQDFFVDCIGDLHRRDPAEGPDTDHVAALTQALSILDAPGAGDRSKLVFLLTDGRLDVTNSPQYGGDPDARTSNAQLLLADRIGDARDAGVQIWPLGFGQADQAALDAFAAGGAQQDCNDLPDNRPRARIATSSEVVARTLLEALASANCAKTTGFDSDDLPSGSEVDLTVQIPEISTDGVIVVLKGDRRVRVTYIDPNGDEVTGNGTFTSDDSTFTRSTNSGTVETLRIQNPRPGEWTVRLTAGSEVPAQVVAAAAMWQGVLQAIVSLDPAAPQASEDAVIRVRLQTRAGAINDQGVLDGIRFGAEMTGAGVQDTDIDLADDGRNGDTRAGDGEYTGHVTIPADAEGVLTFVGTVNGPGVVGARTPYNTVVTTGPPPVTGSITVDGGEIRPGGQLRGRVVVDTADGQARRLELRLGDLDNGTNATISPTRIDSRPGRVEQDFVITFGPGTEEGKAQGRVVLVDAEDTSREYASTFLDADVEVPDPWWVRFWWLLPLAAVLATAAVAVAHRFQRAHLARRHVGNVTVHLWQAGSPIGFLPAPDGTGTRFPFVIQDADGGFPRLDNAFDGSIRPYLVTRNRNGVVQLRSPGGEVDELSTRIPVVVERGLGLTYSDTSDVTTPGSGAGWPGGDPAGRRPGADPYEDAADPYRGSAAGAPVADPPGPPADMGRRTAPGPPAAGPPRAGSWRVGAEPSDETTTRSPAWRDEDERDGSAASTRRFDDGGARPPTLPAPAWPPSRPPGGRPRNDELLD